MLDKPLATDDNGHELAKRGTYMNRQQYRLAYREARKQARFISTFHDRLTKLDASKRSFPNQAPGFCFTRLHGDTLRWIGGGERFSRPVQCHRTLLPCLRSEYRPKLPA